MTYEQILAPIRNDLARVEEVLIEKMQTDIPLLTEVSEYILKSGGKRFRPALLLLAAGATGQITEKAHICAAVIEYIHTATLLHDDVVDNSDLRRSQKAARSIWGNEVSVLAGDYLFTISFQFLAEFEDTMLIKLLSNATTQMAKGELIQLQRDNSSATEEEYLDIIFYKTASLVATAMSIGGLVSGSKTAERNLLYECGKNIGLAFQLIDDALDYDVGNVRMGKPQGVDLKERKITMPLSYLLGAASPDDRERVLAILDGKEITDDHVSEVFEMMKYYGSNVYTLARAREYTERSKKIAGKLPRSVYTESIIQLAEFIISRKK